MVDDRHMRRALELAQSWAHTHPNPRVGSVVVAPDGEVLGEGRHEGPGTAHAEVMALARAGDRARGSTVYVTLEPCTHHGRTPPCVDALVAAGVAEVVVGAIDPDPRVAGQGVERLRAADIAVESGVMEDEARGIDRAYFHHRETGLPLVTLKWAMTLDGSVAAADGTSQWITGESARTMAHELRSRVDGVVVGAGTLRADDPGLDVRLDGYSGPQPTPIIVAGTGDLPAGGRVWDRQPIVFATEPRDVPGGELVVVAGEGGHPDPVGVCEALAARGLLHLLLEGGPTLAGAWWRSGVVVDGVVHIGARIGGGTGMSPLGGLFSSIADARDVEFVGVDSVGEDIVISFEKKG